MLEAITYLGKGGIGLNGQELGTLHAILQELQSIKFDVLAGQTAGTKHDLAAIRPEDTIISAIDFNSGVPTDVLSGMAIVDPRATGTVTLSSAVAGNTVTINGHTYTAVAGTAANYNQFSIDGNDTADAAALAAAINACEAANSYGVIATSALGVVTVRAVVDGAAGNAVAMTKSGAPITLSGATLAGGTATGGVTCTSTTHYLLLQWANKR